MGRKTTWKEIRISERNIMRTLEATHRTSAREFAKYTVIYEQGANSIETNMSWALLRRWFSFAGVSLPRDILTADLPSWEMSEEDGL